MTTAEEDNDIRRIRAEHALLVREKAEAEAAWHKEVRTTLKDHGESLIVIKNNVAELTKANSELGAIEVRVKALEDFKLKAVAYWTAASTIIIAIWKGLEHIMSK